MGFFVIFPPLCFWALNFSRNHGTWERTSMIFWTMFGQFSTDFSSIFWGDSWLQFLGKSLGWYFGHYKTLWGNFLGWFFEPFELISHLDILTHQAWWLRKLGLVENSHLVKLFIYFNQIIADLVGKMTHNFLAEFRNFDHTDLKDLSDLKWWQLWSLRMIEF